MALIGSINNWGEIQGQINEANGVLTGVISSAELVGGQIVGMRGLKGDKGDTGDTGATGADGFSPSASVSKVGDTATITITDKDGTTTAEVHDGSGGGASAFIAEYGVTSYADIKDAYDEDAIIICMVDDSGNTAIHQLAYFDDANDGFVFTELTDNGWHWASIVSGDTWDDGYFLFASTDTATQLRDGLMSALDWQKLDGIASGAEVNVQSDWNEADSTADDFIKNKPTIPSKTSDLNNDSGFTTKNIWYGTSTTSVADKIVTTTSGNFELATGNMVRVKFTQGNSYSNATLNVDGTGAKDVKCSGWSAASMWQDNEVVDFVYDGTYFQAVNKSAASVYSYGLTMLSDSTSSSDSSTAATSKAVKSAYDEATDATATPTASKKSKFDSDAHMNSTDMTTGSGSELEDFIDGLNVSGGEVPTTETLTTSSLNHLVSATATLYRCGRFGLLTVSGKNTTSALAVGNDATFTITNLPTLYCNSRGIGYSGSTCMVAAVGTNGNVTFRATGYQWVASYDVGCTIPVMFA